MPDGILARLDGGLIPAVPVPFRGATLAADAQRAYAGWMARHDIAGVAVWAHTGRGPHLTPAQRREVLATWRRALPNSLPSNGLRSSSRASITFFSTVIWGNTE